MHRYAWLSLGVTLPVLIGCQSIEDRFIYNPSVYPVQWRAYDDPRISDVWFVSNDGLRLHGLFARHPDPQAFILFAHGRNGNVTSLLDPLTAFVERHQVSVLVFDYRGYGRSAGKPSESGLYEDARAARAWLANEIGKPESEIILMGRSLGAAVVSELAAHDGARGLIIENGFTSLAEVVKHHAPLVPANRLLVSQFDSLANLAMYEGPVLISHGSADEVIPFSHGVSLYEAARGWKHLYVVEGGQHNWASDPRYQKSLDQFIAGLD